MFRNHETASSLSYYNEFQPPHYRRYAVTRLLKKIVVLFVFLLISGCGTSQKTVFEGQPKSDAERDYRAAVKTLESGSSEDAIKAFNVLKLAYPYATRWTTLADLRIADAYRNTGDYATAAVSYQDFIRTYPTHSEVAYAAYEAANCYYELMPADYFFLPDPWQRDRKTTQQAERALNNFIRKFPEHEKTPVAQEQYREVRKRLANHEIDVAEFYFKQKAYQGVVARLEKAIQDYPDVEVIESAHILLAHSYLELKDPVSAKRILKQLLSNYPQSTWAKDAQSWINKHTEVP